MMVQITDMLGSLGLDYTVEADGIKCDGINIIPVYRASEVDVMSIANRIPSKIVLEGEFKRDLLRLRGLLTPKKRVYRKQMTIVASFDCPDVPQFVKDIYEAKDYEAPQRKIDLSFMFRGKTILWFRFLVMDVDRLFLSRVVGHPDYKISNSTSLAMKWILENYPQYRKVRTLATSRLAHYYRIGFVELRANTLEYLSRVNDSVDGNYLSASKIEYYLLEYDYNSNLPLGRNQVCN